MIKNSAKTQKALEKSPTLFYLSIIIY